MGFWPDATRFEKRKNELISFIFITFFQGIVDPVWFIIFMILEVLIFSSGSSLLTGIGSLAELEESLLLFSCSLYRNYLSIKIFYLFIKDLPHPHLISMFSLFFPKFFS